MRSLLSNRNRRAVSLAGVYTVEMAITMPVLLFLLFGFFELSRANLMRNLAQDAAYEAAREVIVAGAHASEAEQVASDLLQVCGVTSPTVTVSPTNITPNTEEVSVTISFPVQTITGFADAFLTGVTFTGQCQLQREGFHSLSSSPSPPPPGDDDDDD